ncbi:transposase [Paenibacillus vietnamensis]|uniref:transposase n=1 Tax=Paenibacillus vietnamensis TaxID=2590547 RepID=UPI0037C7280F
MEAYFIHVFASAYPPIAPSCIVKMLKRYLCKKTVLKLPHLKTRLWDGHLWQSIRPKKSMRTFILRWNAALLYNRLLAERIAAYKQTGHRLTYYEQKATMPEK